MRKFIRVNNFATTGICVKTAVSIIKTRLKPALTLKPFDKVISWHGIYKMNAIFLPGFHSIETRTNIFLYDAVLEFKTIHHFDGAVKRGGLTRSSYRCRTRATTLKAKMDIILSIWPIQWPMQRSFGFWFVPMLLTTKDAMDEKVILHTQVSGWISFWHLFSLVLCKQNNPCYFQSFLLTRDS